MNKKISIITIIIGILIVISGCSASEKPESIVSEFIGGMKGFDLELMASKINPADSNGKEDISNLFEDDEDQFQRYFLDYLKSNAKKIDYKIKETKINEDKAVVSVDFKYVDGGQLFKATFAEYIEEVFSVAFSDDEMTDEENSELFLTVMKEQSELIEESFVEKMIDIECIKVDKQWYIDKPSEELLDVVMSNILSVGQELEDVFNSSSDNSINEPETIIEQVEADDINIIEKGIGDEITLTTIKLKVTKAEETQTLTATYGSPTLAKEDAKFVLVSLDITNITKSGFSMPPNLLLVDNQGREFNTYSDSIGAIDDYLDYRDLSPSIKESGRFIYELPKDATSYYMIVGKSGTSDVYKIILE